MTGTTIEISASVSSIEIASADADALALANPVQLDASHIQVHDAQSYSIADAFLKRIKQARAAVAEKIEDKLGIKPIREGLDRLYALRREINERADKPLAQAEAHVKKQMGDWQLAERKRIEQEEAERLRKARELERQAEETRRQASSTADAKARAEAEERAAQLNAESMMLEHAQPEQPTRGRSSAVRFEKVVVVKDFDAFILGVASGDIPNTMVVVDEQAVRAYLAAWPEAVAQWPGVVVEDKAVVAGRR